MGKHDEKFEEMTIAEENLLKEIYMDKLAHFDMELKVRMELGDAGFTVVEPKFDYENKPSYIEHQRAGLKLAIREEKVKILAALNTIERNVLHRADLAELKAEREANIK